MARFWCARDVSEPHLDPAPTPRRPLPPPLGGGGRGGGARPVGKPLPPRSANPSMPLSPTLSPRSAGGEREKSLGAVSRCALPEQARSQCAWSVPLGSPVKQQIRIHH